MLYIADHAAALLNSLFCFTWLLRTPFSLNQHFAMKSHEIGIKCSLYELPSSLYDMKIVQSKITSIFTRASGLDYTYDIVICARSRQIWERKVSASRW